MRIVSGKNRGKIISAPKNLPARPTTDMAKESLFNILNNYYYFDQISVLDLFSGTGNLTYEFLSRGSERIVAIDEHSGCVGFINKMINELNGSDQIEVIRGDVLQFLSRSHESFDVIFADPPYDFEDYEKVIELIFENKVLNDGGMFILEHDFKHNFEDHPHFYQHRKYGSVNFSIFSLPSAEDAE